MDIRSFTLLLAADMQTSFCDDAQLYPSKSLHGEQATPAFQVCIVHQQAHTAMPMTRSCPSLELVATPLSLWPHMIAHLQTQPGRQAAPGMLHTG